MPKKIIYADDAIDAVTSSVMEWDGMYIQDLNGRIREAIEQLPSAPPQRIKGRWVRKESDLSWWYECSECGESPLYNPYAEEVRSPFCPWCGAEMRQGEQENV